MHSILKPSVLYSIDISFPNIVRLFLVTVLELEFKHEKKGNVLLNSSTNRIIALRTCELY